MYEIDKTNVFCRIKRNLVTFVTNQRVYPLVTNECDYDYDQYLLRTYYTSFSKMLLFGVGNFINEGTICMYVYYSDKKFKILMH